MNRKFFLLLLGCLIMLSAQSFAQSYKTDPVLYNDKIVDAQSAIGREIIAFVDFMGNGDLKEAEGQLAGVIATTQAKTNEVKAMPGFDGNVGLRNAAVALFQFYERTFDTEYREMLQLMGKEEFGPAETERFNEILTSISTEEAKLDEEFKRQQNIFATTHNIILQENELQEEIDDLSDEE